MKEHPIPQDITGYRFHIVGSMTLKQFGEVLIGVIIAFLIYQTNLIAIIKWPLVIFFFGGGLLSAFVPIEERPLSHWISTFFSILYKPTQFFWKRTQNIPEPFLYKGNKENLITVKEVDLTPARRQRIKEFITSTKTIAPSEEDLTFQEQKQISSVLELFQIGPQASQRTGGSIVQKPDLTVRVRSLRVNYTEEDKASSSGQFEEQQVQVWNELPSVPLEQPTETTPQLELPTPVTITVDDENSKKTMYLATEQVAQDIVIPQEEVISVKPAAAQNTESTGLTQQSPQVGEQVFMQNTAPAETQKNIANSAAATFNKSLPFPDKPTIPNKLVGMVLTANQDIIPNAIVEISTEDGHVVRAVKTNALGQFSITTPLRSGKYLVNVQKEGFAFEPVRIELKDQLVDPLEIRSESQTHS